ncbi:MAG: thioredoxin domain-containing protein [Betaproteobacteria bacterium]
MRTGLKVASLALVLATIISTGARAAGPAGAAGEPDAASIDAIVRKLENSGALDAALDRALSRQAQRKQQADQAAETQRQAQLQAQAKSARAVDTKLDHVRGKASAEVSLIEYTDFECPFCKQFHGTPKALLDRYQGRVNWVIRNYPLPFHDPAARKEALAAECVGQLGGNDAYWKYADALFASTKSNGGGLPDDKSVDKLAESVGIKSAALGQCMNADAAVKRIELDIADGNAAGVSGTPTTVVRNNKTGASVAVVGALPAGGLDPAIEQMLRAQP